ncbi:MAG: hypothetical protein KAH01_01805 [Caldisericia bacterium]|nr:hypothetical protein [Caldisericia bacterium]
MKNKIDLRELLILLAFVVAILIFPALIQLLNGWIYALWDVQPGLIVSNVIYLLPNLAMLAITVWFLKLDGWTLKDIGANFGKIIPGFLFVLLALVGLYVILPLGTALFFEPQSLYVSARQLNIEYIVQFISTWGIAGICIAIMSWGYLLNKTYSVLTFSMSPFWKQVVSILIMTLIFTLLHCIRFSVANATSLSFGTIIFVFSYSVFCSYIYVRTENLYIAAFMQAAYAFPPLGLTVGGRLVTASFGFIFVVALVIAFIVILTETYQYWGKIVELNSKDNETGETEES